jgi:hypothetical protein
MESFKVRAWKAGIKQPTKSQQRDGVFFRNMKKLRKKQNNLHSQGRQEKGDVTKGTKLHAHLQP